MPSLSSLVPELQNVDVDVYGLCDDTRDAKAGDLFLAVSGEHYSTAQMLEDLQGKNVAAVVVDRSDGFAKENRVTDAGIEFHGQSLFAVKELARKRGKIASLFHGKPSDSLFVVAVTGTNGKTSCSQFIASALGENCGVIGTMGWGAPNNLVEPGLTTPSALRIQDLLAKMLGEGAQAVCVEASSHGLDQYRLDGTAIDVAVFTNLTRDHLDYHGNMEAYKDAKKRLFKSPGLKAAVLNRDDSFSTEVELELDPAIEVVSYSIQSTTADVYFKDINFTADGIEGEVQTPWGDVQIFSSLIGDFNAKNLLTVVSVLGLQGLEAKTISNKVNHLVNIKGRMDKVVSANGALVIIDYAHTPDALENALTALRCHTSKNLICVMGCGGDRDSGKRALMGEVATRLADITIVTDDNPRSESSDVIIEQIVEGAIPDANYVVVPDRGRAIDYALGQAGKDDVVLIAGKGHEDYQEIAGIRHPFSDYTRVSQFNRAAIKNDSESTHENRGA